MKGNELFDIINDIDERFVQELYEEPARAEVYRLEKRRGGWIMPTLAGAACLAVIVGATAAVRLGGKEQFTSDREFPDGKPDWVYDGAAGTGEDFIVDGDYYFFDGKCYRYSKNGESGYYYHNGLYVRYPENADYPLYVLLDYSSPFYSSNTKITDYDEYSYGNFRNLPFSLTKEQSEALTEEIIKDDPSAHVDLRNYSFSTMLYHPSYRVWEPADISVLGADYIEELGCDVPAFRSGEVVYAGAASNGNAVIIKHADDDYSLYGYLDELRVKVGDTVDGGQTIATTGSGGINEYAYYDLDGNYIVYYDCVLTLWHAKRAVDISEWNRYVDSRKGLNCENHTWGWYLSDYNQYLKAYYPEVFEKSEITPEEWASRPHVKPTKHTPDGFDFFNTGDKDVYGSNVTTIPAANGEEVYAVDGGEVVFADWYYGGGKTVVIKHTEEIYTLYCHLNRDLDYPVKVGDVVKAGQLIGYAGSTGEADRICVGYGRRSEMVKFTASETVKKTLDVEAAKKLGSDTPFKEELCYIAVEFPDGTKRYFKDNLPKEFKGVDLSLYDIITTIEPGTGEYFEEEIEGGILSGYR